MAPVHLYKPLSNPSPTSDNGAEITKLFLEGGEGTTVLLERKAIYPLYSQINFHHARNTLATEGYPLFETGEQAILETRGEKEAGAINMFNYREVALKRVHVRGCRGWGATKPKDEKEEEELKKKGALGWIPGGGALVWMGGPESSDAVLEGCRLEDPRGWTAVHVCDWAIRAKVLNNHVGPCGQQAQGGPWADGLSIAGKDSIISGNTVVDATDGAIVVFCAPGSTISNNTIIARERDLLGAINMVDDFPFNQDFSNTRVVGNTIRTEGAFIRLAIGCGPTCWSPWNEHHTLNKGGSVLHNYLGPGTMGYGISLSGVKDFTVLGNSILPGTSFSGDTYRFPNPVPCPPTAFVRQWTETGRVLDCQVQDGFIEGEVQWMIGIEPGVGQKLAYGGGQLRMSADGKSDSGEGGLKVKGGTWQLSSNGEVVLRDSHSGKAKWRSGVSSSQEKNPVWSFSKEGELTVKGDGGKGNIVWDPTGYIRPVLAVAGSSSNNPSFHPELIIQADEPFLSIKNKDGNTIFATSYSYNLGAWELQGDQWIAITPSQLRGSTVETTEASSPALPPRPATGTGRPGEGPPPVPERPHQLSSLIKKFGEDLLQSSLHPPQRTSPAISPPPPIPPRLETPSALADSQKSSVPSWLWLNKKTGQLILHSSPKPTDPLPESIHWKVPGDATEGLDSCWLSFQGDANLVLYFKKGEQFWVPWASNTNKDMEGHPKKLVLKGIGEEGGPALELWGDDKKCWSTK